jgi:hypothetical protein
MRVRVTPLDGKLPNLALMRLAAYHRAQGDDVRWEFGTQRKAHEPAYDQVYGSAIFTSSTKAVARLRQTFPGALVGGSGGDVALRVEQIVPADFSGFDYSGYPDFTGSVGYAMRGCRFKCGFCIVPKQEGAARSADSIATIWRGDPHPRDIHLLDNDFFGNPNWRVVVDDILAGGFRVCINQGVNIRLLSGRPWAQPKPWGPLLLASAEALANEKCRALVAMVPRADDFKERRIYCAWDNLGDEEIFFEGVRRLVHWGWKPRNIMAYMLIGYAPRETWDAVQYRFYRMIAAGIKPYPMVHDRTKETDPEHYRKLRQFQRWAVWGIHRQAAFSDYRPAQKRARAT